MVGKNQAQYAHAGFLLKFCDFQNLFIKLLQPNFNTIPIPTIAFQQLQGNLKWNLTFVLNWVTAQFLNNFWVELY